MYVVVRHYRSGSQVDELVRRQADVRQVMQSVPGFAAYYLVRSDNNDSSFTVTVCQDQAGTTESTRVAADWLRQNVPAAASTPPEVIQGEVAFNF